MYINVLNPSIYATSSFANAKSLGFADASDNYLSMSDANFGALTDYGHFSFSFWFRRTALDNDKAGLFGQWGFSGSRALRVWLLDDDRFEWSISDDGASVGHGRLTTTATYGADSTWKHVLGVLDISQAAGDRMRLWIEETEITAFDTDTNPTSNMSNETSDWTIGRIGTTGDTFAGQMDEIAFGDNVTWAVSDLVSGGAPKDLTGLTGLKSWVRSTDSGSLVSDEVLATDWTNNNTVTESSEAP